ncbi:MAG: phosphoribosyl-AMP cyclohydrolase [Eggerthellaceae bacterium]|nr:phosphoribosyl-AMP cyclohydrolase [Eggerthellaceae bacterium]
MATIDDIKYDDKGLVPAVLIDCDTRQVLMVAWMNAESLSITLDTGLATFWSRSRQELWTKGMTSGNLMHVRSITADCDCDTLLVEVHPDGPACHKGTVSCFTDPIEMPVRKDAIAAEAPTAKLADVLEDAAGRFDLHMHTTVSDGEASPEEMVEEAIGLGLSAIGITDHSFTDFDTEYCMGENAMDGYQAKLRRLALAYKDRITILCGMEQDMFSEPAPEGFDYLIGSAHYVEVPIEYAEAAEGHVSRDGAHCYVSVDETEDLFVKAAEACFGGDYIAFAEAYYQTVSDVIACTGADIIGHVDLFAKYNEGNRYFDEDDPRYVRAWQKACDKLLATGAIFEINQHGRSSGWRSVPYPAPAIYEYLQKRGARFIATSDAHSADELVGVWG